MDGNHADEATAGSPPAGPRGGEPRSLAGLLGAITTGPTSPAGASLAEPRSPSPKTPSAAAASWSNDGYEVCCNCGERLSLEAAEGAEAHGCCVCQDAGFVRYQRRRGEEGFGRAHPCPACASRPATPEAIEHELERLRIPAKFRHSRIGTWLPDNGRPRLAAQAYVLGWPPAKPLLLLSGPKGVGKTHLACGILRELFDRHGKRGQFWPVVDLLDRYRATYDEDRATETVEAVDAQLRQCAVLVLDDLGTHKSTEWAEERLFRLIDERYRDLRPLVVTTNVGLQKLPDRIKSRLADGSCSTLVNVSGPDRRAPADS